PPRFANGLTSKVDAPEILVRGLHPDDVQLENDQDRLEPFNLHEAEHQEVEQTFYRKAPRATSDPGRYARTLRRGDATAPAHIHSSFRDRAARRNRPLLPSRGRGLSARIHSPRRPKDVTARPPTQVINRKCCHRVPGRDHPGKIRFSLLAC